MEAVPNSADLQHSGPQHAEPAPEVHAAAHALQRDVLRAIDADEHRLCRLIVLAVFIYISLSRESVLLWSGGDGPMCARRWRCSR